MTDDKKTVFSKAAIEAKQKLALEAYTQKIDELRKTFKAVASTSEGEKMLKYIFLLCGGDSGSVMRDKSQDISLDDTLLTLGARSVWDTIRFNLTSETMIRIEQHNWEDQK